MKHKVKIFKSNAGFDALEAKINIWLDSGVQVVFVSYADNKDYCSALIVYQE